MRITYQRDGSQALRERHFYVVKQGRGILKDSHIKGAEKIFIITNFSDVNTLREKGRSGTYSQEL